MKIIENFDLEGVPLVSISPGEMFVHAGKYYMRCKDSQTQKVLSYDPQFRESSVAVDLATGELLWISNTTKVPPIYARIRINGRSD